MDRFYFEGFDPNQVVQHRADRLFDKIIETTPSDSNVYAVLEWDGRAYHCSIEIDSHALPFAFSTAHTNPLLVLEKAEQGIMRKLEKWKNARFRIDLYQEREASKTG